MARIAIVGGHGKIARHLERLLADDGHAVDAVIRDPDQSDDVRAAGATPVVLDVENASTADIGAAFAAHDAVVFAAGAGGGDPDRTYAVDRDAAIRCVDAASAESVPRFVLVSYFGASVDHGVAPDDSFFPYAEAKAEADQYLRSSDLRWTIVAPGTLSDDDPVGAIATRDEGAERGAKVARADVAAVIRAALDSPNAVGRMIEFVGGDTDIATAVG